MRYANRAGLLVATALAGACTGGAVGVPGGTANEICGNQLDDDGDGTADCVDSDCAAEPACVITDENCVDGRDNDFDGSVDCSDSDCAGNLACSEDCVNGIDDNGDALADCDDPICKGVDPSCGEICGDGIDNDGDAIIDCADSDCFDVIPPCGNPDNTSCAYGGEPAHPCACADGVDNDNDGTVDAGDLQCFGPFDDDEGSYATGIPGDNNGSKGDMECPFDGNSGPGNDMAVCCNPADPTQNVVPNGCDNVGCCEIDANGNLTGEHVYVSGACEFTPACGTGATATLGCACNTAAECSAGEFCVLDDDVGPGFCSTCEQCPSNTACENPCSCGETCFGGFVQPASECGGDDGGGGGTTCPTDVTACPTGTECDATANESCVSGCCYATCPVNVTPCTISSDCPTDKFYYCITGCCIESA